LFHHVGPIVESAAAVRSDSWFSIFSKLPDSFQDEITPIQISRPLVQEGRTAARKGEKVKQAIHFGMAVIVQTAILALPSPAGEHADREVHYNITDLGTLGGDTSLAYFVGNRGIVTGTAALSTGASHATLWIGSTKLDIGTPGLGGLSGGSELNSIGFSMNASGKAVGAAEIPAADPNGENFCGYGSGKTCKAFLWRPGLMLPLPTLGGPNGQAISINSQGQAVGVAEKTSRDSSCVAATPGQVLDYGAVLWNPAGGIASELRPLPGDSVAIGLWVNDEGEVVGQSGSCGNTTLPPLVVGPHAVIWDATGTPHDLGNFGATCDSLCVNPVLGVYGNTPLYISNRHEVVGAAARPDGTMHGFFWTPQTNKLADLGTVAGDIASVALSINSNGDIVGGSFNATGSPRAFLRRNGQMLDLNTLLTTNASIYALLAQFINDSGDIAGFGVDTSTGNIHAFLATPCADEDPCSVLSNVDTLRIWRDSDKVRRLHTR
jgi:probable HAF family extracellular repeat protein